MITSVTIESFRGVREGGVEGLAPISILVGPNNQGKSTVLEAIAAVGYSKRADRVVEVLLRRGGPPLDALTQIVTEGQAKATIAVEQGEGEARWTTTLITPGHRAPGQHNSARAEGLAEPMMSVSAGGAVVWLDVAGKRSGIFPDPLAPVSFRPQEFEQNFPVRFVDVEAVHRAGALEDAYTELDRVGRMELVVRALQRAMAGLRDLRILKSRDKFILHAFYANGPPVPVFLAGDGFKRLLVVAADLLTRPGGVLLLEEPETFQHPRYLEELATLIHVSAREGTQVVLSTHSIELIDLLLNNSDAEGQTYPAVHRMRLHEGKLRATSIPRESAHFAREILLEDLRA